MNAYRKAAILLTAMLLPFVLLFMRAIGYPGGRIVAAAWMGLCSLLVYALRNARTG